MQSLMPIHCFLSEIQIIKNGFTGPISYRVFRETGPWAYICSKGFFGGYIFGGGGGISSEDLGLEGIVRFKMDWA